MSLLSYWESFANVAIQVQQRLGSFPKLGRELLLALSSLHADSTSISQLCFIPPKEWKQAVLSIQLTEHCRSAGLETHRIFLKLHTFWRARGFVKEQFFFSTCTKSWKETFFKSAFCKTKAYRYEKHDPKEPVTWDNEKLVKPNVNTWHTNLCCSMLTQKFSYTAFLELT